MCSFNRHGDVANKNRFCVICMCSLLLVSKLLHMHTTTCLYALLSYAIVQVRKLRPSYVVYRRQRFLLLLCNCKQQNAVSWQRITSDSYRRE